MSFNASKCNSITITRKVKKIDSEYSLHSTVLERVKNATYLGIELSCDLTWSTNIVKAANKANRQLAFIRRNLKILNSKVKETAYFGLVRPILEYGATIWDPHHKKYKKKLEMIQRRAARFVLNRYHIITPGCVTKMLDELQWELLEHRRSRARLNMFFKVQHALIAIPIPNCVKAKKRQRPGYPNQYQIPQCNTDSYKESFFPRTLKQWNGLPPAITSQSSPSLFSTALSSHSF
jgi:hypothetical protein